MITVEDINSINLTPINEFYEMNTSDISTNAFEVTYDFMYVTHSISEGTHTFSFEIHNNLWRGGYYVLDSYTNVSYDSTTSTLTITTTEDSIKLGLYLCSITDYFNCIEVPYVFDTSVEGGSPILYWFKNQLGSSFTLELIDPVGGLGDAVTIIINSAGVTYTTLEGVRYYVITLLKKSDLIYDLSQTTLTSGVSNKVYLNVDDDYLPDGSLVGDDLLDITVTVGEDELPVSYDEDENDYYFTLDLTNKVDTNTVNVVVNVYETDYVNPQNEKVALDCSYTQVNNFEEFNNALTNMINIIELTDTVTIPNNIILTHDLLIKGNENMINLQGYSFNINPNIRVNVEDTKFIAGSPVFIQQNNSNLKLSNCTFEECRINDQSKGSIIYSIAEDTSATVTDCTITNSPHSIYYNGILTVTGTRFNYNTYNNYIDTDYAIAVTLYDGTGEIINNSFTVDFNDDTLLTDDIDIKYASAIIAVGELVTLNGYSTERLRDNNSLPFFSEYGNNCNTNIKYYYTDLGTAVQMSTIVEGKGCCHTILGTDYVFKDGVTLTLLETEEESL